VPKPRILIAQHHAIEAWDLEEILLVAGYHVSVARNTDEALDRAVNGASDLALLDVHLPGSVDPVGAAFELGRRFGSSVVYITTYAPAEHGACFEGVGPLAFLRKPYGLGELLDVVESALAVHTVIECPREFSIASDLIPGTTEPPASRIEDLSAVERVA
jgi:CheY-like chemotaxis protein